MAFNNGRKVTVTAKFAAQLVAPERASAAPRMQLGNISPSSTHGRSSGSIQIFLALAFRLSWPGFSGSGGTVPPCFVPQAKPSREGIGVVARSAPWRELMQFLDIASA